MAALTGTETLLVLPTQANGAPAAIAELVTVAQISALGAGGSSGTYITPLNTVGNGTITAVGIYGKVTTRGGAQFGTPFTDTTDTAANIFLQLPASAAVGNAFKYTYINNTNAVATISGGAGVTVSGITTVFANSWVEYLVTYSAVGAMTIVGIEQGYFSHVGTTTANSTSTVTVADVNITPGSIVTFTLKTVGGTVGSYPTIKTITTGTGFTYVATASDTSQYNYQIQG